MYKFNEERLHVTESLFCITLDKLDDLNLKELIESYENSRSKYKYSYDRIYLEVNDENGYGDYCTGSFYIHVKGAREESDKEYQERLSAYNKEKAEKQKEYRENSKKKKDLEYKTYLKLKQKFEGGK